MIRRVRTKIANRGDRSADDLVERVNGVFPFKGSVSRHCFAAYSFFKQKTAYEISTRDWSSDVSSDLFSRAWNSDAEILRRALLAQPDAFTVRRSGERRGGEEGRYRWGARHYKKRK